MKLFFQKSHPTVLFLFIMLGMMATVFFPLLNGKILFNANHLVAFYNPWASSASQGWGIQVPQKPVGTDDIRIFYPQRTFTMDTIRRVGEIPFWNPYNYSGNYHAGLSETALFYPLNILFFIFPQIIAWNILMLLQPLLFGFGTFLFLRIITKHPLSAIYGGIVMGFSQLVLVRMVEGLSVGHTLLWMPYILWSVESWFKQNKIRFPIIILMFLVCSLTAGWFQYTAYIVFLGIAYAGFRFQQTEQSVRKQYVPIFLPFLLFPFFALFHIIPVLQTFLDSPRGLQSELAMRVSNLVPLQHLLTLLFPDLWGNPATFNHFSTVPYKESLLSIGIIPFLLAVIGYVMFTSKPIVRFFTGIILVTIILGTDNPIARIVLMVPIPIISTFIPVRIFALTTFALVLLSAIGFEQLVDADNKTLRHTKSIVWSFIFFCMAIVSLMWVLYKIIPANIELSLSIQSVFLTPTITQLGIQARNTVVPLMLVSILAIAFWIGGKTKRYPVFLSGIIILTVVQIIYSANKFLPFSDKKYLYPDHPLFMELHKFGGFGRFIVAGEGHIDTDTNLQYGLYSPEGVGSMYIRRYGELVSYVTDAKHRTDQVPRIESYLNPPIVHLFGNTDPVMQRFMRISGIPWIVTRKRLVDSINPDYTLTWEDAEWQLWKDTRVLPRSIVTGTYAVSTGSAELLAMVFDDKKPESRIMLEKYPPIDIDPFASGSAEIMSYTSNTVTIRAQTDKPALVYLSDTYSPSFRAKVDDKSVELLRANYTFRAVMVPPGVHTIYMYFDTMPWKIGVIVSLVVWFVSTLCVYAAIKHDRISW